MLYVVSCWFLHFVLFSVVLETHKPITAAVSNRFFQLFAHKFILYIQKKKNNEETQKCSLFIRVSLLRRYGRTHSNTDCVRFTVYVGCSPLVHRLFTLLLTVRIYITIKWICFGYECMIKKKEKKKTKSNRATSAHTHKKHRSFAITIEIIIYIKDC